MSSHFVDTASSLNTPGPSSSIDASTNDAKPEKASAAQRVPKSTKPKDNHAHQQLDLFGFEPSEPVGFRARDIDGAGGGTDVSSGSLAHAGAGVVDGDRPPAFPAVAEDGALGVQADGGRGDNLGGVEEPSSHGGVVGGGVDAGITSPSGPAAGVATLDEPEAVAGLTSEDTAPLYSNYVIEDGESLEAKRERFAKNVAAMKLRKVLARMGRKTSSDEAENAVLQGYSGFGGLGDVFKEADQDDWADERAELLRLVRSQEILQLSFQQAEKEALESSVVRLGPKAKFKQNMAAIRLLKTLTAEGRQATPEEQAVLARYVGWGGLSDVFWRQNDGVRYVPDAWRVEALELESALTREEYIEARASTLNAFFTPTKLVDALWGAMKHLGVRVDVPHADVRPSGQGTRFLESSMGPGVFIGRMPQDFREAVGRKKEGLQVVGCELDPITGGIAKQLYPQAEIHAPKPFQKLVIPSGHFDVAIGNPPFGSEHIFDAERENLSGLSIHNYFLAKNMEALRPGGVMAFVVTSSFLDAKTDTARRLIAEEGQFLGAVRLPAGAFSETGTQVVTDLVFFKKAGPEDTPEVRAGWDQRWLNSQDVGFPTGETTTLNDYFSAHPENLLGQWEARSTQFEKEALTLVPVPGQDTQKLLQDAIARLPADVYKARPALDAEAEREARALSDWVVAPEDLGQIRPWGMLELDGRLWMRLPDEMGQQRIRLVQKIGNRTLSDDDRLRVFGMLRIARARDTLIHAQLSSETTEDEVESLRAALNAAYDLFVAKWGALYRASNARLISNDPVRPQLRSLETFTGNKSMEELAAALSAESAENDQGEGDAADGDDLASSHADSTASTAKKAPKPKLAKKSKAKGKSDLAVLKAPIFSRRTQWPTQEVTHVDSALDAVRASRAIKGFVDINYISKIYKKPVAEVIDELAGVIYSNPHVRGGWESKDDFLSGDVKTKLDQQRELLATTRDPMYELNVAALEAVIPPDVEAVDIHAPAGALWMPDKDMADFVASVYGVSEIEGLKVQRAATTWSVKLPYRDGNIKGRQAIENAFTGGHVTPTRMLEAVLNGTQIKVTTKKWSSKENAYVNILDEEATSNAAERVAALHAQFNAWIWSDQERRERLARIYNDRYNRTVQVQYDGSHLLLPGKVSDDVIQLRPPQKNVIWRAIQSQRGVLLEHAPGVGKTFEIIAISQELNRLGLSKKAIIAVPNHLVDEWGKAYMALYPQANIMVASDKNFDKQNRQVFLNRIADSDAQAIIIPHSALTKIANDPATEREFIEEQIALIEASILDENDDDEYDAYSSRSNRKKSNSVKMLERRKKNLENKLEALLDRGRKDETIHFGMLGVDAIYVDEAHEYKNLARESRMTNIRGLGNPAGSIKASDLLMKGRFVAKRTGGRNIIFATATPLSNSMGEMHTMLRYLDHEGLRERGLLHFDAWARVFAKAATDWEISPSGSGYRMVTRLSKFTNMPELMQHYLSIADVVTNQDIQRMMAAVGQVMPIPKVTTGRPVNVVAERSPWQAAYIGVPEIDIDGNEIYPEGSLIYRAENLSGRPVKGGDNALRIMSDARKVALDPRLISPSAPDYPGSKTNLAVENIVKDYRKWDHLQGTQLVFCDLSTPKSAISRDRQALIDLQTLADAGDEEAQKKMADLTPDEMEVLTHGDFSVYDDMKAKLMAAGIPAHEIAFIHDATTDLQRAKLYQDVNDGKIRVLMGSTAKMGTGMNVQKRLVGLHHLDAPWRPSDLEQREGRIIRQGNMLYEMDPEGFSVNIFRYGVRQTLDSFSWQTLENKAIFIEQVKSGACKDREMEDISSFESVNAAQMKAETSGNPDVLTEITLRGELRKLEASRKNHDRTQHRLAQGITHIERMMRSHPRAIEAMKKDFESLPMAFYEAAPVGENAAPTLYQSLTLDCHLDGEHFRSATMATGDQPGMKASHDAVFDAVGQKLMALRQKLLASGENSIEIGHFGGLQMSLHLREYKSEAVDGSKSDATRPPLRLLADGVAAAARTVDLVLKGAGEYDIEIRPDFTPVAFSRSVMNKLRGLKDGTKGYVHMAALLDTELSNLERMKAQVAGWPDLDKLQAATLEHAKVIARLKAQRMSRPAANSDHVKDAVVVESRFEFTPVTEALSNPAALERLQAWMSHHTNPWTPEQKQMLNLMASMARKQPLTVASFGTSSLPPEEAWLRVDELFSPSSHDAPDAKEVMAAINRLLNPPSAAPVVASRATMVPQGVFLKSSLTPQDIEAIHVKATAWFDRCPAMQTVDADELKRRRDWTLGLAETLAVVGSLDENEMASEIATKNDRDDAFDALKWIQKSKYLRHQSQQLFSADVDGLVQSLRDHLLNPDLFGAARVVPKREPALQSGEASVVVHREVNFEMKGMALNVLESSDFFRSATDGQRGCMARRVYSGIVCGEVGSPFKTRKILKQAGWTDVAVDAFVAEMEVVDELIEDQFSLPETVLVQALCSAAVASVRERLAGGMSEVSIDGVGVDAQTETHEALLEPVPSALRDHALGRLCQAPMYKEASQAHREWMEKVVVFHLSAPSL